METNRSENIQWLKALEWMAQLHLDDHIHFHRMKKVDFVQGIMVNNINQQCTSVLNRRHEVQLLMLSHQFSSFYRLFYSLRSDPL